MYKLTAYMPVTYRCHKMVLVPMELKLQRLYVTKLVLETKLGSLQEHQVLLSSEPSFQCLAFVFHLKDLISA